MRRLALSVLVVSSVAAADWPMTRHDGRRTGEVLEPANLRTPAVSWRRYMGGELAADQVVALDVEGDGSVEVVLIAGGKLVAKRPDDTVVWETAPLALTSIVHVANLDAAGGQELIVIGESAFLGIVDARTGALLWRMAPGTFGTSIGSVRLADFDGDGLDELYAADNGCGSVNGKPRAMAWRFSGGFGPALDDGSKRLWELPANREYYCGFADVVADLDGDRKVEIVAFGIRRAYVYDASTGTPLPASATEPGYDLGFSIPYGVFRAELASLGSGKWAIVAASNNNYDVSVNSRSLWVMTWDATLSQGDRLTLRWRRSVADLGNDRHAFAGRLSGDLDGDGTWEAFSTFTESGRSTIEIFELLQGTVKARLPDATLSAIIRLRPTEVPTVVAATSSGLSGFRFTGFTSGTFPSPAFTLPSATLLPVVDRQPRRSVNTGTDWATVPLPTQRGLVVVRNQTIEAWSTEGAPTVAHSLALPAGVTVRGVAFHRGVSGVAEGLLVARSDGYLLALNPALEAVNFTSAELSLPGIRTGGAYSGPRGLGHVPVTMRFDGGVDEVLARDSLGRLFRLDTAAANLVTAPAEVWSWPGAVYPLGLDLDRDGRRDLLVAFEGKALVARSPSLVEQFRVEGEANWEVASSLAPLSRDAGWLFAYAQVNPSTGDGRVVATGASGVAWRSEPIITAGSGQGYTTVDDFDQDGDDDVIGSLRGLVRFFSGADGGELGSGAPTHSLLPINVRGRAGPVTTIGAASYHDLQGLSLATPPAPSTPAAWSVTLPDRFYSSFAATLACRHGLVVGNAGYQSPHFVVIDALTGFRRAHLLLSRGQRFDDEGALADAGVMAGSLGNATALRELWPGQSAMLVGSTDGYLYAVDVCAPGAPLLWTMNLRSPVGEVVTGDLDGDGQQDLVVTAADGFLYGIGPERFPAPKQVMEIDPAVPDAGDIDESMTPGALVASWDPVPNATGYEYALLTAGGTALTRHPTVPGNPFVPVGPDVTTVTYSSMLRAGARYLFAVRALGPSGASTETLSDGVTYQPREPVDAGVQVMTDAGASNDAGLADAGVSMSKIKGGAGCGCEVTSSSWLVLVLVLASRRRAA